MKKLASLVLVLMLLLFAAIPAEAKQPLYGEVWLEFNLAWPGPQGDIPDWIGTIIIDGVEYDMLFFNLGSGKAFVDPFRGTVIFFGEIWKVFDPDSGELLLWGDDEGVTTTANSKYRMNGNVYGAFGRFTGLEGRKVHISGVIEWYPFGAPHFAPGTFRIN